jgi:hypothetical protein
MESFHIPLEARDPAIGRFRAYRIDAGTDLFSTWLVDTTYVRIGTPGRTVRYIAAEEGDARRIVRRCLQRRHRPQADHRSLAPAQTAFAACSERSQARAPEGTRFATVAISLEIV